MRRYLHAWSYSSLYLQHTRKRAATSEISEVAAVINNSIVSAALNEEHREQTACTYPKRNGLLSCHFRSTVGSFPFASWLTGVHACKCALIYWTEP